MIGCPTSGRYGCSPLNPHDENAPFSVVGWHPATLDSGHSAEEKPVSLSCISGQVLQCARVVPHGAEKGVSPDDMNAVSTRPLSNATATLATPLRTSLHQQAAPLLSGADA